MYHGSINGTGCSKFESLTTTWLKEPWVANKIFIINRFKNFWHRLKASLSSFKMNYQTHSYHSWVIAIFVNPTSLSLRWRCLIAYALLPRSQCDRVPMRSIDIQMFSTRSSLSLFSIRNCTAVCSSDEKSFLMSTEVKNAIGWSVDIEFFARFHSANWGSHKLLYLRL